MKYCLNYIFITTLVCISLIPIYADSDTILPKHVSGLNGWHGIKIKKTSIKGCTLIFPKKYGYHNKEQLNILRTLINNHKNMKYDLDCMLLVNYDALGQIKYLAIERQDPNAALMLLNWSSQGGFNLDGELAEEYVGEYEIPVLMKFKRLSIILDDRIEKNIARDICNWFGFNTDKKLYRKLVLTLRKNKLDHLADKIVSKCGK